MSLVPTVNLGPFVAGDDVVHDFTVANESGVPANITGATPRFVIVERFTGAVVVTTVGGEANATAVATSPTTGVYRVTVPGAVSAALLGAYLWESDVVDASGAKSTTARGSINFDERRTPA